MGLEEMKLAWRTLDTRLERQQALNLQLYRDGRLDKLRRGLRPLVFGQGLQLLVGVAVVVTSAAYWATHLQPLHLLVCGLLVQAYGALLIAFAVRNLYLIQRIDHSAPVLELQRRVAELRAFRVRVEASVNAVVWCFIWIPLAWMALAGLGRDPWSRGFVLWALACGLAGLVAVAIAAWLVRRMGWMPKFADSTAGRGVLRAKAALDEIARFEQE